MRLSRLFGKTLRQTPAEAETPSHQLLLKAGMIHQEAAGVYSYLPLAWRALRKIEGIIREEMDAAGSQELLMPALQPLELWEESGRSEAFGPTLFRLQDRRQRWLVLGPTHEEVITGLVKRNVRSYRDLPLILYQIQTKFRDEPRPRGGLVRVREFAMKDAYSFDADWEGLDLSYQKMVVAYQNIFRRCGLPALAIEADSGAIGGRDSQEFMLITPSGEDEVISCPRCGYAANREKAVFRKVPAPPEEPLPLEEVSTPSVKTIEELSAFLGVPEEKTLKAVFYAADGKLVFVSIRGDLEVNEVKLRNALRQAQDTALHASDLRLATEEEVAAAGLVAGSASAVGLAGITSVADDSILMGANFVGGGNKPDTHVRNVNYPRDFAVDILTDIAAAREGDPCAQCGTPLQVARGIEVGHVFKLGTAYSEKLGAFYLDREGVQRPIVMGCYGIGVGRLLAAVLEYNHDERGILWPATIAPYQVHLCAISPDHPQVTAAAEQLYIDLSQQGYEVLYDDREESPGVKFNDADLLGIPIRLTVSPRTVKQEAVEVKPRREKEAHLVPLQDVASTLRDLLEHLEASPLEPRGTEA